MENNSDKNKDRKLNNLDRQQIGVIHQNVQSLGNSVDSVNNLLKNNPNCKVLCVTEHWKALDELKLLALDDFSLGSFYCRERGEHGGSAVYVHKNLEYKSRNKINKLSVKNVIECAAVECKLKDTILIIISIYRPPTSNIELFLNILEKFLCDTIDENKKVIVAGDFNIELLKSNEDRTDLLSLLTSFNLEQTIFENTRITANTASCIDNIFINCEYVNSLVVEAFISDHAAQKITLNTTDIYENKFVYKRIMSLENKNLFLKILKEQDWADVYLIDICNVNEQWQMFMNAFIRIFNHCFPLKCLSTNRKMIIKDNDQIKECKKTLDLL